MEELKHIYDSASNRELLSGLLGYAKLIVWMFGAFGGSVLILIVYIWRQRNARSDEKFLEIAEDINAVQQSQTESAASQVQIKEKISSVQKTTDKFEKSIGILFSKVSENKRDIGVLKERTRDSK